MMMKSQRFVVRFTHLGFWLTTTTTKSASAFSPNKFSSQQRAFSGSSSILYAAVARPAATLTFGSSFDDVSKYNSTLIVGKKESMEQVILGLMEPLGLLGMQPSVMNSMMNSLNVKTGGSSTTLVVSAGEENNGSSVAHRVSFSGLPSKVTRNNHPMSVHTLSSQVVAGTAAEGNTRIVVINDNDDGLVGPLASAIAKAFPLFNKKSDPVKEKNIHVVFCKPDGTLVEDAHQLKVAQVVATNVRLAGRLVDSHPELLTTTEFAKEVERAVEQYPNIKMSQIIGEDLKPYGGIYGVGKGADCPPRMMILEYDGGEDSDETVCLVGKGIVYDTGGLSIKGKDAMPGMKYDMGGAAGVLGGFLSAVELGVKKKVYCILCFAENALGPKAYRPDDILEMYSGKTVEVNNCDAEGRLVLADGVAHATRHFKDIDLVVDLATLTGACRIATGKKHAGVLANTAEVETRVLAAGMHSGDLCFPLLYAPELLMDELKSEVADMKNSVKDRNNAQSSCAGHFIEAHLDKSYEGGWVHIDMAGPGGKNLRGTGYGVGLVLRLLEAPGF